MKRALVLGLATVGLAVFLWTAWQLGWLAGVLGISPPDGAGPPPAPADAGTAQSPEPRPVVALGRIEPAGGLIDIAAPPGDRVERILVQAGKPVTKGQALVVLESASLRALELKAAESQLQEAEARREAETRLADVRIATAQLSVRKAQTADLDIKAQEKKLQVARTTLALARKDQARLAGLREGFVSPQETERQALVVQQAEAAVDADASLLEKLTRTQALSLEAAQAELKAAEATKTQVLSAIPVESLRSQRDLAKRQCERMAMEAPCDGTVLKVFVRPGETVAQRPVLQMADLTSMVVVAEVYETDARRVEPGQTAEIHSPALPKPYDKQGLRGKVESKAKMITSPRLQSLDPLAPSDRRVVEVRILLDEENSKRAADWSNLQVDVTIEGKRE